MQQQPATQQFGRDAGTALRLQVDGNVSDHDQMAMKEFRRFMDRFAGVIGKLHNRIPPRFASGRRSDLIGFGKLALDIRLLGRDDMREFLRIAGINIYDVLQENFDSDLLKGALSLDAVLGTHLGPRSPNTIIESGIIRSVIQGGRLLSR